jgi:hypothetical protein
MLGRDITARKTPGDASAKGTNGGFLDRGAASRWLVSVVRLGPFGRDLANSPIRAERPTLDTAAPGSEANSGSLAQHVFEGGSDARTALDDAVRHGNNPDRCTCTGSDVRSALPGLHAGLQQRRQLDRVWLYIDG